MKIKKHICSRLKTRRKPKVIKKNTLRRRLRALDLKLDRRQRELSAIPETIDETMRKCPNCQHEYMGRICPQCGQAGTWERYTWKQAILNFLDIWGLGNRPMFRTLKELFWRPGYMIRDYLNGHRQFYFPPFKLLAVTVVLLIFFSWLTGEPVDSLFSGFTQESIDNYEVKDMWSMLALWFKKFGFFLSQNMLYRWLFIGVVAVICIRIAFRHVSRYNLVETYIFLIFVLSQMLLCKVPNMLLTGFCNFIETHYITAGAVTSGQMAASVAMVFVGLIRLLLGVYFLIVIVLLLLDFRQFYGLTWKSVLWHFFLTFLVFVAIVAEILLIIAIFVLDEPIGLSYMLLALTLVILSFYLVDRCLTRNKNQINRVVSWTTKLSVLPVLVSFMIVPTLDESNLNVVGVVAMILLFFAVTVTLSLLPIFIYKKYHRTWPTFLAPILLLGFCIVVWHMI